MSKLVNPHGQTSLKPLLLKNEERDEEIKKAEKLKKIHMSSRDLLGDQFKQESDNELSAIRVPISPSRLEVIIYGILILLTAIIGFVIICIFLVVKCSPG